MTVSLTVQAEAWLGERSAQAHSIWAKSGTIDGYLSLPQHLADSACVAEWLWDNWVSGSLKSTLSNLWSLPSDEVKKLYIFLSGTHDVGKATVSFAIQLSGTEKFNYLLPPMEQAGLPIQRSILEPESLKFPHGLASALILQLWLAKHVKKKKVRNLLGTVLDAHHGFTSHVDTRNGQRDLVANYPTEWATVHTELLDSMAELTNATSVFALLNSLQNMPNAAAQQLLTGLVIMADWIASNENAFPYQKLNTQPQRLQEAMQTIDLPAPWAPKDFPRDIDNFYRTIFDWPDFFKARPVQLAVVEALAEVDSPALLIIEAPTGEGKTEAGLAAAHIIGHRTAAQGVFFAAPTMSTANGLFERTRQWARHSSKANKVSSMFLAHSKRQLSKQFKELPMSSIGIDCGDHGEVVAKQWLSGRKTGILADFVVGTVDQVLMLALQARHSMLRHVGLAGKVVIIDEVHAYDAYMSQYLQRALQWLARYGVSVILMSATLPPAQRKQLAKAYASEVNPVAENAVKELRPVEAAYPLVTVVHRDGATEYVVPRSPTQIEAHISIIDDDLETLLDHVGSLASESGIFLVICNTIARAQAAFDALSQRFPAEAELHHSAFLANKRSEREDTLRQKLGPEARRGNGRPEFQIVVATQVAEQSLDIDADVLFTDIAPIDLVIQRAGRLHRHDRPKSDRPSKLRQAQIYVRGVDTDSIVPSFDSGASAIYGDKLLLSTMLHLPKNFSRPDDIAELVHAVYHEKQQLPAGWDEAWTVACKEASEMTHRAEHRASTFLFPQPKFANKLSTLFEKMHVEKDPDSKSQTQADRSEERGYAQVRDTELTVEVVAIQRNDYGYSPLGDPDLQIVDSTELTYSEALALAQNTLRLPARLTRFDSDFNEIIEQLEIGTPSEWRTSGLLRGQVALIFDAEGYANLGRFTLQYSDTRGLSVIDNDTFRPQNSNGCFTSTA